MLFCPKCGSILRPKDKSEKKILFCACGFTKNADGSEGQIKEAGVITKKIEVVENLETLPKVKINCEKCKNTIAFFWTQQTRSADEPETRFFKCTNTKCNHTWREYA